MSENLAMSVLDELESESIFILREVVAEFEHPVMMYSVGKDSSVVLHLVKKAFYPGPVPFPLLHINTSFKFPEMYEFRDKTAKDFGLDLKVYSNSQAVEFGINPMDQGTIRCCGLLKTQALLDALSQGKYDAVIGGARRDEERSRAKERIFSFRDRHGQWDPRIQRPEMWTLFNGRIHEGESIRVFPLSNWTEIDVWRYIERESIPIVPLYFAKERLVVVRNGQLLPVGPSTRILDQEQPKMHLCRFRTLGCYHCTTAIESSASTVSEIIEEIQTARYSERTTRVIDHDQDGSMEKKKREGYF